MPLQNIEPYWRAGTATVAANSKAVTGAGTNWLANVMPGDQFFGADGRMAVIDTVNSNTSITLLENWPGAAQTAGKYTIYRISDSVRVENFRQRSLNLLETGNVSSLANLALAADKLLAAGGAGTLELADFTSLGRSLLASTSHSALWTAAGLSDGYVSLAGAGQTISSAKTFTAAPTFNTNGTRFNLPGFGSAPNLLLGYNENGNFGLWDQTNSRWHFLISPIGQGGIGMVNPAYVTHLVGQNGVGWARLVNNDTDNLGDVGGSLRLWTSGGFSYAFDGVDNIQTQPTNGNTIIRGSLSAASKSFLIDHPLDPYEKDLVFAATESPGLFVEFTARATLVDGRAVVDIDEAAGMMPGTWDALATDNMIKSLVNETSFARLRPGQVENGTFEIICEDSESSDTVVWTVIGRRRDPFVMDPDNPQTDGDGHLIVEPEKPDYDPAMEDEANAD